MKLRLLFAFIITFIPSIIIAQQPSSREWTLQQAIEYAQEHNLSIRQNELNVRLAKLQLLQTQLSQLPSINSNVGYGTSFGRSIDPTSNQFINSSYNFVSFSGSANVLLFGWFQTRNNIKANELSLRAAQADKEQLQNDVSLNVATGYMRLILAKEQVRISRKQVSLSAAQLEQTKKFVQTGRLPELSAKQMEAQLGNDSATLIGAIANYDNAIIDMKALLNLDFTTPFDIVEPDVTIEKQFSLQDLNPEYIYETARQNFYSIKSSEWNKQAAHKRVQAAKGALYPQLALSGQYGTNYSSSYKELTTYTITGAQPTGSYAVDTHSNKILPVYQPVFHYETQPISLNQQLRNNARQTISLGLNIPLFNGWQATSLLKQAKINWLASDYNQQAAMLKLKQDVYKAYNDAHNAIQKYYAAQRAAVAAQEAFIFAQKRHELGLTNTVEYLTTQNTQFVSESNLQSAKYDLIFKLKVIDYYLGKTIQL